ncbi:MAG: recombinase family protein [Actinomycetota bacterium]|jgi:DNA invertase Pin-like site-specific DNA recombinase|nr:recombinase family protein [Actinomycetota bacterium]
MLVTSAAGKALEKISSAHLERLAYVYVRQSTAGQVRKNQEGRENQEALAQRATALGWSPERVRVIDSDLGLSGKSADAREGFRELVSEVSLGHAGIVLCYEASRLARNNADWYALLDLCTLRGTLIADTDGVYDAREYNDRLLLGLRGMMSEAELHLLRLRMDAGKMRQVEKGTYRQVLPTGLVRLEDGRVLKHPDQHARRAIGLIFERFRSLQTVPKVLKSLREDEVLLPRFRYGGLHTGELLWVRPTNANIYSILCNPAYAGAFVYGRRAKARDGSASPDRRVNKPMEEWITIHKDMYPAYISWEEFLANQQRLKQNGYRLTHNRLGAPRKGPALLSGLAVCGHCGRRMSVTYSGSKSQGSYLCNALRATHGAPSCLYVAARRVDEAVVEAFFEAVKPSEISLLEEVLAAQSADRERLLRHHHDSVKAASYEVRLAEKRYRSVDPENRLVASELEKGWEAALRSLSDAREASDRFEREHQQTALDPNLRAQLANLGRRLPELWESGKLRVEHKKELLRSLISRVIFSRPEPDTIEMRIVWISGAVSTLPVRTPIRRARDLRGYDVLVGEILALNAEGYPDSKIARRLTEEGFHSARGEEGVPARFVTEVRRQHGQGSVSKVLKSLGKLEGRWTVLGLSKHLQVDRGRIYKLIRKGVLPTERHPQTGNHLIEDDPELIAGLRTRLAAKPRDSSVNATA